MEGFKSKSVKIVAGLILTVVGVAMALFLPSGQTNVSRAATTPDTTTDWTARKLLTVQPRNANSSEKDYFAIGVSQWDVTYSEAGTKVYQEHWSIPQPPGQGDFTVALTQCFADAFSCNNDFSNPSTLGNAMASNFLWGTLIKPDKEDNGVNGTLGFQERDPNDPYLFKTSANHVSGGKTPCDRGESPGTCEGFGQGNLVNYINDVAYMTTGAYGWLFTRQPDGSADLRNAGVAMPLKWHVDGWICNSGACP